MTEEQRSAVAAALSSGTISFAPVRESPAGLVLDFAQPLSAVSYTHLERLKELLESKGYGHILKKYETADDVTEWYQGEMDRLHEHLRESLGTEKERFYRQELESFRGIFHKPVIYAAWNWEQTVLDALHQAGFSSFEEQAQALAKQRMKKKH